MMLHVELDLLRVCRAADDARLVERVGNQLFKTVIADGVLPRKTFSMGHAEDKRYYVESRKIK